MSGIAPMYFLCICIYGLIGITMLCMHLIHYFLGKKIVSLKVVIFFHFHYCYRQWVVELQFFFFLWGSYYLRKIIGFNACFGQILCDNFIVVNMYIYVWIYMHWYFVIRLFAPPPHWATTGYNFQYFIPFDEH